MMKMPRTDVTVLIPESKEHWLEMRTLDVTSTEVSALFGLSPYQTELELFYSKLNQEIVSFESSTRMKWGNRLEAPIAEGIAEDQGWLVHPFKNYVRDSALRAGSSFDYLVAIPNGDHCIEGILEIKNVDFLQVRDKWIIENGEVVEAPAHIEIQVQHQLMITGYQFAKIGALVGGNEVILIHRERSEPIIQAIQQKVTAFWERVQRQEPPTPDWERDAEIIAKLYNAAEPGKIISSTDDIDLLAAQYSEAAAQASAAEKRKQAAKARLLTLIGDAEKVLGNGYTISAGVVGPADISYRREGYRNFRVFNKKEKSK